MNQANALAVDEGAREPGPLPKLIVALILLNIGLQLLNLASTAPRPNLADGMGYMAWGETIVVHGKLNPSLQLKGDHWYEESVAITNHGQRELIDPYPMGWGLMTLPFMAAGQALTWFANHFLGRHYPMDGRSPLLNRGAWVGVYFWVDIGLICAYRVLERLISPKAGTWAAVLIWMGTSAAAYTWRWPYMSHGLSLAALAIVTWQALKISSAPRLRPGVCLLFGIMAGLFVCVRLLNIFYLMPVAILLFTNGEPRVPFAKSRLAIFALAALGAIPPLLVQSLAWKTTYGSWYFSGYAARGESFTVNWGNFLKFICSSHHGLFFLHPITLLALSGLLIGVFGVGRSARDRFFFLLVMLSVVMTIFAYGFWHDWALGDSYGARWACDCYLFWAIGFALFLRYFKVSLPALAISGVLAFYSFCIVTGQAFNHVERNGNLHIYIPGRGWRELP